MTRVKKKRKKKNVYVYVYLNADTLIRERGCSVTV